MSSLAPTTVIICRVSDALRRQRFEERAARGRRHRVHIDGAVSTASCRVRMHADGPIAVKEWPTDWDERRRGKDCPMCAEGRPDDNGFGPRIFVGQYTDAYLQRRDVGQPGYTIAIWRGRHVADPTGLSEAEARQYFDEVLRVGRAIETHYRPIKMNFDILGNTVPHLHTHILPRYHGDGSPMAPSRLMRGEVTDQREITDEAITRDAAALRALLA